MRKYSQTKAAKIVFWFFALLFAAILIHPDWDLLDVHDVRITSARLQVHASEVRLTQALPVFLGGGLDELPYHGEWLQFAALGDAHPAQEPSLSVLRI